MQDYCAAMRIQATLPSGPRCSTYETMQHEEKTKETSEREHVLPHVVQKRLTVGQCYLYSSFPLGWLSPCIVVVHKVSEYKVHAPHHNEAEEGTSEITISDIAHAEHS